MEKNDRKSDLAALSFPKQLLYQLLNVFSRLLYHQLAWMYDGIASVVSIGAWRKWVLSALPHLDGPRILEIGFGPGHLMLSLHQKGLFVCGLDESHQMVHITARRLKSFGFHPNLVRGDASALPFPDEDFHQIVMTFPAEYIFKSDTLSEIQRVLKRGGNTLVVPLAWITGRNPWERLIAWISRTIGEAPDWDPGVLEPLKKAGFDLSWEMIELSNSKIVLIHMSKSETQELRPPYR